jgi:hypothetical protein
MRLRDLFVFGSYAVQLTQYLFVLWFPKFGDAPSPASSCRYCGATKSECLQGRAGSRTWCGAHA